MDRTFLSGVIEGFYGRPWTKEQRLKLFSRMRKLGLNTYLYAPKDDAKHRGFWRDLYTVEELDILSNLIEAADKEGISFVYAISPGLDMAYSNAADITCLKRKLDQVQGIGCRSFALLFDDIKTELRDTDKDHYHSLALAQAAVTNEIYQHLDQPENFFFCPTEYCSSRAKPSVSESCYLSTIGSKLPSAIEIFWTGPKVVSKKLSIKAMQEVAEVLQRPPLIWDNIHANDYDYTRMFLGPFEGRSLELRPYIRGILTNPNREYEANYVALHTLSQWTTSGMNAVKKDFILNGSPVPEEELQLETDGDFVPDDESPIHSCSQLYIPRQALKIAIANWHEEFLLKCDLPPDATLVLSPPLGGNELPGDPSLPALCDTSSEDSGAQDVAFAPSSPGHPNSGSTELLSETPPPGLPSDDIFLDPIGEPMDCCVTTSSTTVDVSVSQSSDVLALGETMQVDGDLLTSITPRIMVEDIALLVDLFYLPFEYGRQTIDLLNDLDWIISNIGHRDWSERQISTIERLNAINTMIDHVCDIPNKALFYEFYPYLWATKVVVSLIVCFIQWIGLGKVPSSYQCFIHGGPSTWSSQDYQFKLCSGAKEPWVVKGGIIRELQKMLPFECSSDLMYFACPHLSENVMFNVRPYKSTDKAGIFELFKHCNSSHNNNNMNGWTLDEDVQSEIMAELFVGSFLWHSPEYCFVVENGQGTICAYVLGVLETAIFFEKVASVWIPEIAEKYKGVTKKNASFSTQEIIGQLESYKNCLPDNQINVFPSFLRIDLNPSLLFDRSAPKRAVVCATAALKVSGSCGVYTQMPIVHGRVMEFYPNLGLFEIGFRDGPGGGMTILGRNFAASSTGLLTSSQTGGSASSVSKWCHMCYCCNVI